MTDRKQAVPEAPVLDDTVAQPGGPGAKRPVDPDAVLVEFTTRFPKKFLRRVDTAVTNLGFRKRNDLIREAVLEYMKKHAQ